MQHSNIKHPFTNAKEFCVVFEIFVILFSILDDPSKRVSAITSIN